MKTRKPRQPLVYSCSGCSSAAQMANAIAIAFDRAGVAEMSCIAGVGGGVRPLVRLAGSGRPVIGLDGCPLACVKACLAQHGVTPTAHFVLTDFGVKKVIREDPDPAETKAVELRLTACLRGAGLLNE